MLGDQVGFLDAQGIVLDQMKLAGSRVAEAVEQGKEPRVHLNRNDLGTGFEQGAGQAAGAGADLDHGLAFDHLGQAGDLAGDIEVEQEMLAKALLGQKAVLFERLTDGGKVFEAHGRTCAARLLAIWSAMRMAAIRLSGRAMPCPAMSKPVP